MTRFLARIASSACTDEAFGGVVLRPRVHIQAAIVHAVEFGGRLGQRGADSPFDFALDLASARSAGRRGLGGSSAGFGRLGRRRFGFGRLRLWRIRRAAVRAASAAEAPACCAPVPEPATPAAALRYRSARRRAAAAPARRAAARPRPSSDRCECKRLPRTATSASTPDARAARCARGNGTRVARGRTSSCLWQEDAERGSAAGRGLHFDLAVVHLHGPVDHRQPDAAPLLLGREVQVENPLQVIRLDADCRCR